MIPSAFPDDIGRVLRLCDAPYRKGGQAFVYKAELDGRAVAVKVYHRGDAAAATEHRILDEILRDDPSAGDWLVTVLASGTVDDRPFLVFPWMETRLRDWIPGRALPERLAALTSLAEAVARLHRSRRDLAGYRVHRDIKPDNVLLGWEGRWVVRLADLGTAKEGNSLDHTANTGMLTPAFAPPEQALPIDQEPQESWDVHALAVTIFWGITERMPLPALDAPGLVNAAGRELLALALKRRHGTLTAAEALRLDELRLRDPADLLDLEASVGWSPDDTTHLRRALEDAGVEDERLMASMTRALGGALEADGRQRDNDVRRLLAALRTWAEAVPARPVEREYRDDGAPARTTSGPSEPSLTTGATPAIRRLGDPRSATPDRREPPREWRRWMGPAALILLIGFAGSGTVGALVAWRLRHGPASPSGLASATVAGANAVGVDATPAGGTNHDGADASGAGGPVAVPAGTGTATVRGIEASSSGIPAVGNAHGAVSRAAGRPGATAATSKATSASEAGPAVPGVPLSAPPNVVITAPPSESPAASEPVTAPPSAPVDVRVTACPGEGTTITLDGGSTFEVTNFGHAFEAITPGSHTFTWRAAGGDTFTANLDVGERTRFCHDFTHDAGCPRSCSDL